MHPAGNTKEILTEQFPKVLKILTQQRNSFKTELRKADSQ